MTLLHKFDPVDTPDKKKVPLLHRTNRAKHKCSECGEYFRTTSQLRNHFGHKHKFDVSGSGE